jgi:TatD DNase family protein
MVSPYIDIHTHKRVTAEDVISIPSVFLQEVDSTNLSSPFTAGIHPWHAELFRPGQIACMLEKLKGQGYWIAVGEAGLDKKTKIDYVKQKEVFEIQLAFAGENRMPVIIHNVKAWNEITRYLKNSPVPFIFHGYHATRDLTRQLLRLNGYFSFGASLLKRNRTINEVLNEIPIDHLFFETDESSYNIGEIFRAAADILQCPVEVLRDQVFSNYQHIFQKK